MLGGLSRTVGWKRNTGIDIHNQKFSQGDNQTDRVDFWFTDHCLYTKVSFNVE